MKKLKALVLDIETAPLLAYVWDRKEQTININQLKQDTHLMAWAAKWLDDPVNKIMYRDQRRAKDIKDDRAILKDLWKLLNEADILITQNGEAFDIPYLNSRFIMNKMPPPSSFRHIDTFKIAKRVGRFTSNSLEYLTSKLNTKYKKLSHKRFPGWQLWLECMNGNLTAWNEMRKYNIHDVLSTEELFQNLRVWAPEKMARVFWDKTATHCIVCGESKYLVRDGFNYANKAAYQRYWCSTETGGCGAWLKGESIK